MYEEVCYKHNYVQEVICRLDFANPIEIFNTTMPKSVNRAIKNYYPVAEPQEIIGSQLQLNPVTGPMINNIVSKQWVFWSYDKQKSCRIDSTSIVFSVKSYDVFKELREAILAIMKAVLSLDEQFQGKRLGLRYINRIPMKGHENWISEQYYSPLAAHKDEKTVRLMTVFDYAVIEKSLHVKMQYGYLNPDYPAVMKNEDFTIDIDAFSQSLIYDDDIETLVDDMHFEVQDCFEKMITQALKDEMNKEDE